MQDEDENAFWTRVKNEFGAESEALELLMEIITYGRNNLPYKHLLPAMRVALNRAPRIKKALQQSLMHVVGD